jgi:hypothetical protein
VCVCVYVCAKMGIGGGRSRWARRASTTMRCAELVRTRRKDGNARVWNGNDAKYTAHAPGEAVIQQIRSTRPCYNLISNNCQTYVLQLLDAIRVSQVKEFGTTLAVYDRLFGDGKVSDLFVEEADQVPLPPVHPAAPAPAALLEGQESGVINATQHQSHMLYHHPEALLQQGGQDMSSGPTQQNSIVFAQQVMNANTTQLNAHDEMHRGVPARSDAGVDEHAGPEAKSRSWSEKTSAMLGRFKR